MSERRPAVVIINAAPGDVRAARGVVGRAIRKALPGYKRQDEAPYDVHYVSEQQMRSDLPPSERYLAEPRYYMTVTDAEMERFERALVAESNAAGFDRPPVDVYHD